MSLHLMLFLQASTAQAAGVVPNDFDLAKVATPGEQPPLPGKCPIARPNEVVVCGRKDGQEYRYRALREEFPPDINIPRAEIDLGGGMSAGLHGEVAALQAGLMSKRIMITVKKKF